MSDNSAIQWTDATWGPTLGCTKVSPGCEHCYAIRTAHRLAGNPNPKVGPLYEGLTRKYPDGSLNWTGKVRLLESRLDLPLGWKKPRRIFVDSQSDLFHETVPWGFISRVFWRMAACQQHTFQILTKRPDRMAQLLKVDGDVHRCHGSGNFGPWSLTDHAWPLPNVWLGVSTEDQATADERIPLLLQTPAAVRFISAEPLLGPIDLTHLNAGPYRALDCLRRGSWAPEPVGFTNHSDVGHIRWVITGGESGPHHRPFDPQWARDIRDQCVAAGVCFFHKQNGGRTPHAGGRLLDGVEHNEFPCVEVAV